MARSRSRVSHARKVLMAVAGTGAYCAASSWTLPRHLSQGPRGKATSEKAPGKRTCIEIRPAILAAIPVLGGVLATRPKAKRRTRCKSVQAQQQDTQTENASKLEAAKQLVASGVNHAEAGEHDDALKAYVAAREIFKQTGRLASKNGARLQANIAVSTVSGEAVPEFEAALQLFLQQGLLASKEGVRLLVKAAVAHEELGQFEEALAKYKKARSILSKADASQSKLGMDILKRMAEVCVELKDLERAEAYYHSLRSALQATGNLRTESAGELLQQCGDVQAELGALEDALASYREARKALEAADCLKGLEAASLVVNITSLEAEVEEVECDATLAGYEEARELFVEADALDTEEAADLLVNIGMQQLKRDQAEAVATLQQALEIFERKNLVQSMEGAKLLTTLGTAMLDLEDSLRDETAVTEEAMTVFDRAREVIKACDAESSLASAVLGSRVGEVHLGTGRFSEALQELEQARAVLQKEGDIRSDDGIRLLLNLGLAQAEEGGFLERGSESPAERTLGEAVRYMKTNPQRSRVSFEVYINLGSLQLQAGRLGNATGSFEKALSAAEELESISKAELAVVTSKMAVLEQRKGDENRALALHKQALATLEDDEEGMLRHYLLAAEFMANCAVCCASLDQLDDAIENFECALGILEENDMLETEMGVQILRNLAAAQEDIEDEAAAETLQEVERISDLLQEEQQV